MSTDEPQIPHPAGHQHHPVGPVTFGAVPTSNRSLGPTGFIISMSIIAMGSFVIGLVFMPFGFSSFSAWLIMGLFWLDVALICWAFSANHCAAREFEVVEVLPDTLSVTRNTARGPSGEPQIPRPAGHQHPPVRSVTFRTVLTPNRSLGPIGFIILMATIVVVSFTAGVAFLFAVVIVVYWPLVGILFVVGLWWLDVALIYWSFRANYCAVREFEAIEVTPDTLSVTRNTARGQLRRFDFQTDSVRVALDEEPFGSNRLRLRSHGEDFTFAQMLGHKERHRLAGVLENEIRTALRS